MYYDLPMWLNTSQVRGNPSSQSMVLIHRQTPLAYGWLFTPLKARGVFGITPVNPPILPQIYQWMHAWT